MVAAYSSIFVQAEMQAVKHIIKVLTTALQVEWWGAKDKINNIPRAIIVSHAEGRSCITGRQCHKWIHCNEHPLLDVPCC